MLVHSIILYGCKKDIATNTNVEVKPTNQLVKQFISADAWLNNVQVNDWSTQNGDKVIWFDMDLDGHPDKLDFVTNNSNQFLLGSLVTPPGYIGSNLGANYLLGGSLSSNCLGINLSNPEFTLDVNGYARIGTNQIGGLGINTNPLDYTLNVNGNMRVSDGYGIMTLTNDVNSNSVTTITPVLPGKTATLQVTDGFFSVSGTTGTVGAGSTSNIGVWKKGIVMVSVQHSTDNTIFASRLAMVSLSNTTYTVTSMITAMNSNVTINSNTSNIVLSNSGGDSRTYTYSITYFPLP